HGTAPLNVCNEIVPPCKKTCGARRGIKPDGTAAILPRLCGQVKMGIGVRIDAKHAIAHNKIMVIDGQTVITGSFNFTKAAEEANAENLLVIRDGGIAVKYSANW